MYSLTDAIPSYWVQYCTLKGPWIFIEKKKVPLTEIRKHIECHALIDKENRWNFRWQWRNWHWGIRERHEKSRFRTTTRWTWTDHRRSRSGSSTWIFRMILYDSGFRKILHKSAIFNSSITKVWPTKLIEYNLPIGWGSTCYLNMLCFKSSFPESYCWCIKLQKKMVGT